MSLRLDIICKDAFFATKLSICLSVCLYVCLYIYIYIYIYLQKKNHNMLIQKVTVK